VAAGCISSAVRARNMGRTFGHVERAVNLCQALAP
jgi:hypothetical protein